MRMYLFCVVICVGLGVGAERNLFAGGHGRDTTKKYEVKHNFRLPVQNPAGMPLLPIVTVVTAGDTKATNPGVVDVDNFGNVYPIPAGGFAFGPIVTGDTCWSIANWSDAEANAEGVVKPFVAGGQWITGNYRVWGYADADPIAVGTAKASSSIGIHARGRAMLRNGVVGFGPEKMTHISGGTRQRCIDPLSLKIRDPDSYEVLYSGVLLNINFDLVDGEYNWENDILSIDAWEGIFSISIPGLMTTEAGDLTISLLDGAVNSVIATGMFSGLALPSIGETAAFDIPLQNMFDLILDLPLLNVDKEYDFDWGMTSFGEAYDILVPEPATLILLAAGLLVIRRK